MKATQRDDTTLARSLMRTCYDEANRLANHGSGGLEKLVMQHLYDAANAAKACLEQATVRRAPRFRLLQNGDAIHAACQSLQYDGETWEPVDALWYGTPWSAERFVTMREPNNEAHQPRSSAV